MKKADLMFIENFLEEVEALYHADSEGNCIPEYINEMIGDCRLIVQEDLKGVKE